MIAAAADQFARFAVANALTCPSNSELREGTSNLCLCDNGYTGNIVFVQGIGTAENSYTGECTQTVQKSYFMGVGWGIVVFVFILLATVILCALNIKGANNP